MYVNICWYLNSFLHSFILPPPPYLSLSFPQISSERDELKEKVCSLEIAKDKALRSRDDLEKQLELAKIQSSEATHSEAEQVRLFTPSSSLPPFLPSNSIYLSLSKLPMTPLPP